MAVKTRTFIASLLAPLATPDGSSLEEKVNVFLATLDDKDVLDVAFETEATGKYGLTTSHVALVVYHE